MRFIRFYFVFIALSTGSMVLAQGEWNNWYFGVKAGLNFQSNPPSALLNSSMVGGAFCATVSDSTGQLLFYSDGLIIYNRNHLIMQNGNNLNGANSNWSRTCIAVKDLANQIRYYIFTTNLDPLVPTNNGLYYSIIDMSLDNGLGGVVEGEKNVLLPLGSGIINSITATHHRNNQDVWLIGIKRENDTIFYYSYLIDKSGVHSPVISSSSILDSQVKPECHIIPEVSLDGQKLIGTGFITVANLLLNEYCNFDNLTGVVSPVFTFQNHARFGCFSPNGKLFYQLKEEWYTVFRLLQYDATQGEYSGFTNSETVISTNDLQGMMAVGKDGRIYISEFRPYTGYLIDSLSVIHHPDVAGSNCSYEKNAVSLDGRQCGAGLVYNVPRYFAYINHTGFCQGAPISFAPNTWPPPDSLWWNFGDPASGAANFSNDSTPQHIFENEGTFTIQMIVRHIDMRYDTAILNLTIEPQPAPNLGPDLTLCENQYVTLDAGYNPQWSYLWSTGNTTPTITVSTSGIYSVNVTSPNGCSGSDEVVITFMPGNKPLPKPIKHN
jgi:hypothetical protein